jgi:hypothetical protein
MTIPSVHFGPWDWVLIVAVSIQGTVLAYVPDPKWKAFLLSLPFPFTIAYLSLGHPVDVTNLAGLLLLLLFINGVRVLHYQLRWSITPAIVASVVGYCLPGSFLARVLPKSEASFWIAAAIVLSVGWVLLKATPYRAEPANKSLLPVWIKVPVTVVVVMFLVMIRSTLQGFMTVFPMVGVIAAYEARHSLWTLSRQMPVILLTLCPMMITLRLTLPVFGQVWSIVLAWSVMLLLLWFITRWNNRASARTGEFSPNGKRSSGGPS